MKDDTRMKIVYVFILIVFVIGAYSLVSMAYAFGTGALADYGIIQPVLSIQVEKACFTDSGNNFMMNCIYPDFMSKTRLVCKCTTG